MEEIVFTGLFVGLSLTSLGLMFTVLGLLNEPIPIWALWSFVYVTALSALIYFSIAIWFALKYKPSKK